MPRERNYTKLHAAAYHFAKFSRKAADIAESVGVADRTIRQFARDPEWDRALDVFGYTGIREFDRSPRRDAAREKDMIYDRARELYIRLQKDGTPHHNLASLTAEAVDMPPRTIRRWAKNTDWQLITNKIPNIRRKPMYVKTQFDTIANLAHYSKIHIEYFVKSPTSDNVYHEIFATLEDNENGGIKDVRKNTLALIPADRKEFPNSGDIAKKAFNDLFEAMLNNESAFDISIYYTQQNATPQA